jgi:hypothetical protein
MNMKMRIVVIGLLVLVGAFVSPTLVAANDDELTLVFVSAQQTAAPGASFNIDAICPSKYGVVTGGYEILSPDISTNLQNLDITVYSNTFHFNSIGGKVKADGWQTIGKNESGGSLSITVRVVASCTKE